MSTAISREAPRVARLGAREGFSRRIIAVSMNGVFRRGSSLTFVQRVMPIQL